MPSLLMIASADVGLTEHVVTANYREPIVPGQWWLELTGPTAEVSGIDRATAVVVGPDALDLALPATQVLASWAQVVVEERRVTPPREVVFDRCEVCGAGQHRHVTQPIPIASWHPFTPAPVGPVDQLATLAHWWDFQADWAGSQPWADDWEREVSDAHRRLHREAGQGREIRAQAGQCPQCDRRGTLMRFGPRREPQWHVADPRRAFDKADESEKLQRLVTDGMVSADPVLLVCQRGDNPCGLVTTEEDFDRWRRYLETREPKRKGRAA